MSTKTCTNCQEPLPDDAVFCPNCRQEVAAAGVARHVEAAARKTFSGQNTITPLHQRETATLEPGSLFAERYEVMKKIGAGGMGVVYLARDRHTGEELVLKLIHPDLVNGEDAVKRLMAEGLTARQIRHPRIVAVYDVAQHNDQPYFTMEYVRGSTLRSWMSNHVARGQDVALATAAGIIKSMVAGIREAHRMGVVHRDLKPENVILVGDPDQGHFDLKILDFGLAKAVKTPRPGSAGSGPLGTPLYMAPEQMTAAETVGPAADVYSLSVMFYELLMEASPQARWEAVSKSRPEVPKAIDTLIEKGLSVRPRSRYPSAAEFEEALDRVLGSEPPPPSPPPLPPPPPTPPPTPPHREPVPTPPPTPLPPPPPPPEPQRGSAWANLSANGKRVVYAIAVFVVIGIIGNMIDEEGTVPADGDRDGIVDAADACPAVPAPGTNDGCPVSPPPPPKEDREGRGRGTTPPPPSPPPSPPRPRTERWRDDFGNVYTVERDGMSFGGAAENVRVNGVYYGHVEIVGVVSTAGGSIIMTNYSGVVYQSPIGIAGPGSDPRTTDALFGTMRFHIDH